MEPDYTLNRDDHRPVPWRPALKILMIVLVSFSLSAFAADKTPANYCHDEQVGADWEKMLVESPEDRSILKLYGLRIGLCQMIDKGRISLEQGIEIWNQEHAKSVIQRSGEEAESEKDFTL
ncbi:MAG: hypothetical protein ACRERU_06035 [Methylococcales bacterium]